MRPGPSDPSDACTGSDDAVRWTSDVSGAGDVNRSTGRTAAEELLRTALSGEGRVVDLEARIPDLASAVAVVSPDRLGGGSADPAVEVIADELVTAGYAVAMARTRPDTATRGGEPAALTSTLVARLLDEVTEQLGRGDLAVGLVAGGDEAAAALDQARSRGEPAALVLIDPLEGAPDWRLLAEITVPTLVTIRDGAHETVARTHRSAGSPSTGVPAHEVLLLDGDPHGRQIAGAVHRWFDRHVRGDLGMERFPTDPGPST